MKTPITVRVDSELLAQARLCARADNRTLTNFIETVLRQRIAAMMPTLASQPEQPSGTAAGSLQEGATGVA